MKLTTLGDLRLEASESAPGPKPLLLLAYLALEGPRERRHLAELFWPQAADPLNSLSAALKQLRRLPDAVAADSRRAWTQVTCDAAEFLAACHDGRHDAALALYGGSFVSGVALSNWGVELEEWVFGTREILADRFRDLILRTGEREAATGRFGQAAGRAGLARSVPGASELDPEEIRRLYALLRAGDHPQALDVRKEASEFGMRLEMSQADARAALSSHQLGRARARIRGNLPHPGTSFVGRGEDLHRVAELLAGGARLVSLIGPGGVGKSRLALEALRERVALGGQDHAYVALDSLTAPSEILPALAAALDLSLDGADPFDQLALRLGSARVLVLMDNFEHVVEGAKTLGSLLAAADGLTLLVTSRERLAIEFEHVVEVGGMPLPETAELFEDRARRAKPGLLLSDDDLEHVAHLSRLVEGSPLGIELAASWVRHLSCEEIAHEVGQSLDLLYTSDRDVADRHRSVRATFEHSWQLLSAEERSLLSGLAVFVGGFPREAAATVVGATLLTLARLTDKSLLRTSDHGRYDRHPLLYQYGAEKLAADPGRLIELRTKHADYYLEFVAERAHMMKNRSRPTVRAAVEAELANISAAWSFALQRGWADAIARYATPLRLVLMSGSARRGEEFFGTAVAELDEHDRSHRLALGRVLLEQAQFIFKSEGHTERYVDAYARGLAILESLGDRRAQVSGAAGTGWTAFFAGRFAEARDIWREGLAVARDLGDDELIGASLCRLAVAERELASEDELRNFCQEAEAELLGHDDLLSLAIVKREVGFALIDRGLDDEGDALVADSTALVARLGERRLWPLSYLALRALAQGRVEEAEDLAAEAEELTREFYLTEIRHRSLLALGRIAMAGEDLVAAEARFTDALRTSRRAGNPLAAQDALLCHADLQLLSGQPEEAARLVGLVRSQPTYSRANRKEVARLMPLVLAELGSASLRRGLRSGANVGLDAVVERLLDNRLQPAT